MREEHVERDLDPGRLRALTRVIEPRELRQILLRAQPRVVDEVHETYSLDAPQVFFRDGGENLLDQLLRPRRQFRATGAILNLIYHGGLANAHRQFGKSINKEFFNLQARPTADNRITRSRFFKGQELGRYSRSPIMNLMCQPNGSSIKLFSPAPVFASLASRIQTMPKRRLPATYQQPIILRVP